MRHILAVFFTIILLSCTKDNNIANDKHAVTLNEISYGTHGSQKMDVHLPPNRSPASTKVIILIHGGGWTAGDKNDFLPLVDTFKRRFPDFAIFNINYRLSSSISNLFPSQEQDVKSALEFIYHRIKEYNISDKFVFIGASAGAHLAMLQAFKYNLPLKASAVVSFFGPSDLTEMYFNPAGGNAALSTLLAQAIGKTPLQDPLIYINSSPVTYISSNSAIPTLLFHGGLDPLINASQSIAVKNKLTNAGVINEYVFYPAGGHGGWSNAIYFDAFNKIKAFLDENVQ